MDYDSLKKQDLKDFARQAQVDVVYSETGRDRDGKG
jgi:transcription initiation factor TFIID subunit 15